MLDGLIFYLFAIPAVLITGISKGGFGGGLGLLAVPMMAMAISPVQAAAIMLPILCLMDLFSLKRFHGHADIENLKILLPAAFVGILLGAFSFQYLTDQQLKIMIGLIALLFVLHHIVKGQSEAKPTSRLRGSFWGLVAGYTSFSVHAGGAPLNIYLLPLRLHKTIYAGTTVVFFAAINFTKLIPYGWLGQFNSTTLLTALLLAPLAPLGVWLGGKLHDKISETLFYRVSYSLLALAGSKLIYDGFYS